MPGGLLQLAAYGAQDLFLTGNPQMSFFIAAYKRHTNFAIESVNQKFIGENGFGKKVTCTLDRIGDLITNIFVDVTLSSLKDLSKTEQDIVGWTNNIGYTLIKECEIEIGGTVIDKQYGMWMGIWYELTTPQSKRYAGDLLIGKEPSTSTVEDRSKSYHLHIPLFFWFCRHEGLALPLIALQFHEVKINIEFRRFDEMWQSLNGKYNPTICPETCKGKYELINPSLYVDYMYLENEERKLFVQRKHNYLIEQVQINTETFNTFQPDIIFNLNLCHPVKEIMWVVQNEDVLKKNTSYVNSIGKGNEWFNFSDRSLSTPTTGPGGGNHPTDPLIKAELQIEGNQRFSPRDAQFFRLLQPFQRHTFTPDWFVYMYSFALHPERLQPSGTCNFSRIDNADLVMTLASNTNENEFLDNPRVTLFATNYNVLQIASGMAGLAYMN